MNTIEEMIEVYISDCKTYYNGSREPGNLRSGIRRFFDDCLDMPFAELRAPVIARIRDAHARAGSLSRYYINKIQGYVGRMIRWAAEYGYIDASLAAEVLVVKKLQRGRHGARETQAVGTVDRELVELIRAAVRPQVRDYIDMMRSTGMRPGEARTMRAADLEQVATRAYVYTPQSHKNKHRGKSRYIAIVGDAFDLTNRIIGDMRRSALFQDQEYLFSPAGDGRKPYAECSLGQAIRRACDKLECPRWGLNQIRHLYATERHSAGHDLEEIQAILGHTSTKTTQIYIHDQKSQVVAAAIRLAS